MSLNKIPGGGVVGHVISEYQKKREDSAREILLKQLANGDIEIADTADQDELIGVIYTYMQAANKGAAKVNLDLLSQAIAGEMKRDQIYPDKFLKYANILSTLTRDEIFLIGTYVRFKKLVEQEATVGKEVFLAGIPQSAWERLKKELIPGSFPTEEHLMVVMSGLIRTGLVKASSSSIDDIGIPQFTILLTEISGLIDFERAYNDYPDY